MIEVQNIVFFLFGMDHENYLIWHRKKDNDTKINLLH